MKNNLIYVLAGASIMFSCSQPKDVEAQKALTAYTQFVDSIAQWNETWKTATDTDFVEMPTDPNDPTKVTIDTIVTLPENKAKSILEADYLGKHIDESYELLNASVTAKMDKMDEEMKKEYEKAKAAYESLK